MCTRSQDSGRVASVNISLEKGTAKQPVAEAIVGLQGLEGDAHAGLSNRQISLLSLEGLERFSKEHNRKIAPGEFAENITTRGADLSALRPLDRMVRGNAELEVTQIGKSCHGSDCSIFRELGACLMPDEGIFARVITSGRIAAGMPVTVVPRVLRLLVVTVSDRVSRGEMEDKSRPLMLRLLSEFAEDGGWIPRIESALVPDERTAIAETARAGIRDEVDAVFCSGGTGIGPRDVTPEALLPLCERTIPGIIEAVRVKHGRRHPNALLSRAVAGCSGKTLLFALPGSPRAAEEYLHEILKIMEHALLMLRGLGHA